MAKERTYILHITLLGDGPVEATLYGSQDHIPERLVATEQFAPFDTLHDLGLWMAMKLHRDVRSGGQ